MSMDPELGQPMKRLAEAIHRAIEDDPGVAAALARIRAEGFSACLLLEITVALSRAADAADAAGDADADDLAAEDGGALDDLDESAAAIRLRLKHASSAAETPEPDMTAADREFLRSLRVRLDD